MTLPLEIHQFELGPMENYIYIVANSLTKEAVVIDPAWDVPAIESKLKNAGLKLKAALITHGHPDHTNGIETLLKTHDIPVYVSQHEASFYKPIGENIKEVDQNYQLELGEIKIDFVHTPGHTPGSQCFHVHGNLISGDTLFLDGCGRCDLPGGDAEVMYDSIANKLMKMPDTTIIYPGHNYHPLCCDSLEHQKKTNPYLQAEHLNQFISRRMG
jgi:glyoxylase-like metal-dependent hydrolase (beta-lactamase superfamily II)